MQGEKTKIVISGILLLFIVSIILIFTFFFYKKEKIDDGHEALSNDYNFSELTDYNIYQSVYQSIYNYYNVLNTNISHLLSLLSEDYKKCYNISSNNIQDFVEQNYNNFIYKITKINLIQNSYYSIYFVEGTYAKEILDSVEEEISVKHLVIFDIANNTYSIIPILNTSSNFQNIIEEYDLMNYNKEIIANQYNVIERQNVTDFKQASDYFSEFLNKIYINCAEAYNIVGKNTKQLYPNYEQFKNVCEMYKENFSFPTIQNYQISYYDINKVITIVDNNSIKYYFYIQSVKEYYVDLIID